MLQYYFVTPLKVLVRGYMPHPSPARTPLLKQCRSWIKHLTELRSLSIKHLTFAHFKVFTLCHIDNGSQSNHICHDLLLLQHGTPVQKLDLKGHYIKLPENFKTQCSNHKIYLKQISKSVLNIFCGWSIGF